MDLHATTQSAPGKPIRRRTAVATRPATTETRPAVETRPTVDERRTTDQPTVVELPKTDTPKVEPERRRWAHVSAMATFSLIIGVVAVAAALTGLLAAEAVVLGVIGGGVAAGGLVGASRRGVTGHSLALIGLIASLGAILLGVLAIGGELSWLDSKTDEVSRLHSWLLTQLPWLKNW